MLKTYKFTTERYIPMLIPRYYFANDFTPLYQYFLSQPHEEKTFEKHEYLWSPGEPLSRIYYIKEGIARTLVEHENGSPKIVSFHSRGTVFPVSHQLQFKIEQSIVTKALSKMEVLSFTKEGFHAMIENYRPLNNQVLNWYASYVNLLIYENAHQEYNNSFIKLCNLLYLFSQNTPEGATAKVVLTQENIADILTVNRVNVARNISRLRNEHIIISHRKWIEIIDLPGLTAYCSNETLQV